MKSLRLIIAALYVAECLAFPRALPAQPVTPPQPHPVTPIETGPVPPDALLEGPPSARLGEMVVMRAFRTTNVDYCEWSVEPEPASMEVVDITEGRGKAKKVTGAGQELHFSSTSVGIYVVMMSVSGPGGLKNVKRRIAYGTIVDDNVLAPAEENMAMDAQPGNLEAALLRAVRSVRTNHKQQEVMQLADAFTDAANEIARGNATTPADMSLAIKRAAINRLGANFAKWALVLQTFGQGMSDSAEAGLLKTMPDHRQACEAAAELLRGEQ